MKSPSEKAAPLIDPAFLLWFPQIKCGFRRGRNAGHKKWALSISIGPLRIGSLLKLIGNVQKCSHEIGID